MAIGNILVIGCVSLDTIHLEQNGSRRTYQTVGGAGLFTALAAAAAATTAVTLYAPKPNPLPDRLRGIESKLTWLGPEVRPDEMPTLEIVHHGQGRATLVGASWGPEALLTPENLKQLCRTDFDTVHVAALSSAQRQLQFIHSLRTADGGGPKLSAGTYARAIAADKASVLQLIDRCNLFFMNRNEASLLFDNAEISVREDQSIFVTDGENGGRYYSFGQASQHLEAFAADELDPTGAGDTFCGATLAALTESVDVIKSAQIGAVLAARVIEKPGSNYYF